LWDNATADFLGKLKRGELLAWARERTPWGGWIEIPPDAWEALSDRDIEWSCGTLFPLFPDKSVYSIRVTPAKTDDSLRMCDRDVTVSTADANPMVEPATPVARPRRYKPTDQDLVEWYMQRVKEYERSGEQPSRDDDEKAFRDKFPGIDRDVSRRVRKTYAPARWKESGRPRKV
jgi:hypothetical protein